MTHAATAYSRFITSGMQREIIEIDFAGECEGADASQGSTHNMVHFLSF